MFLDKKAYGPIAAVLLAVAIGTFGLWGVAAAESEEAGVELQNYFSNANTTGGTAFVQITAPLEGDETGTTPATREGEVCAMIYVFDTVQAMQACCGCPVTADGLLTLNITTQLVGNTASPGLQDGSIRILSTLPNDVPPFPDTLPPYEFCDLATGVCCDPTATATGNTLTAGSELVAWSQHIQDTAITESEFQVDAPDATELNDGLPEACADITQLASGQGTCTCTDPGNVPPGPTTPFPISHHVVR